MFIFIHNEIVLYKNVYNIFQLNLWKTFKYVGKSRLKRNIEKHFLRQLLIYFVFSETLGIYTMLVYDLDALKPNEIIKKAVLQLEPGPSFRFDKAINVSFYSLAKQTVSKTYLGTASIRSTLDLATTLGSRPLIDLSQLVVQMKEPAVNPSIGLVLYSMTTANRYEKGHELSKLLSETIYKRRKRSVIDNEIDNKPNSFKDDIKRKKKKKKGLRASKLQVVYV